MVMGTVQRANVEVPTLNRVHFDGLRFDERGGVSAMVTSVAGSTVSFMTWRARTPEDVVDRHRDENRGEFGEQRRIRAC